MAATGEPLTGLRVGEVGGIGPAPSAAMMRADVRTGVRADVVRVDRPRQHLRSTRACRCAAGASRHARTTRSPSAEGADGDAVLSGVERTR